MSLNSFRPILFLSFVLTAFPGSAEADIYAWTDASGHVTYSDTPPPKNASLVGVVRDTPVKPLTPAEAAAMREAAHQAELQAMSQRIQLLEQEIQQANRSPPPPPPEYMNPSASYSPCEPGWYDCGPLWSSIFLRRPVAVVRTPFINRRFGVQHQFGHQSGFHRGSGSRIR